MTNKDKLLTNTQFLKKGLNLLGRNRKTVLSHHKTFELTDELEVKIEEILTALKEEKDSLQGE